MKYVILRQCRVMTDAAQLAQVLDESVESPPHNEREWAAFEKGDTIDSVDLPRAAIDSLLRNKLIAKPKTSKKASARDD